MPKNDNFDKAAWDLNASKAAEELEAMTKKWSDDQKEVLSQIASWLHRWVFGPTPAGYKRLGRILVSFRPHGDKNA